MPRSFQRVQTVAAAATASASARGASGPWSRSVSNSSISRYSSMHCCPAPPWTSSSTLIADAIAPFSGSPQVTDIRLIAMDGACGPWSTEATSAASSRPAWSALGRSPRSISQIICGKLIRPINCSIG